MAKNKINISDGKVVEENGQIFLEGFIKEEKVKIDIVETVTGFMGLDGLEFKLREVKPKQPSERKPVLKFVCKCGKIIKSNQEIKVKCLECESNFEDIE